MITVLSPGILTTVQDKGRLHYASIGVPISGAMDSFSAELANQIIGNNERAAVLEVTFGGCKLKFESETIIGISGANFSPKVNDSFVEMHQPIKIQKGDILSFGKHKFGVRTYIAVLSGIQSEEVLGSKSYYNGITKNSKLVKGQQLEIHPLHKEYFHALVSIVIDPQLFSSETLSCFEGPEFDLLSPQQKQQLNQTLFTISKDNNRMGYQLIEKIENNFSSMLTSAVLPGTVQLTPSGKLLVLMKDAQVTGGYPRILQLSASSMNALAQKTTGQNFRFDIKHLP